MEEEIRTFDTGATRDTDVSKPNYIKALCPLVLRRYVTYLDKHRLQPDGSVRDFDNWKQGIPKQVYMEGLGRHEMAAWLIHAGFTAYDNHGPVEIEDALCGVVFNAMGYLHEILKVKGSKASLTSTKTELVPLLKSLLGFTRATEDTRFGEQAMQLGASIEYYLEQNLGEVANTEWHCDRHKTTGIGDSCPVCRKERAQQA